VRRSNLAFESQHLLHAVDNAGIKNWVSLSEGQQGTLGWLTVRVEDTTPCTCARLLTQPSFLLCAQTNERKQVCAIFEPRTARALTVAQGMRFNQGAISKVVLGKASSTNGWTFRFAEPAM
tara:strand:- start:2772 stop:3134 length:363 start_codon:yes stop_codon:yes gene_type:complete